MARLAVTLAVIFSLFLLSQARFPFNLPAYDVNSDPKTLNISSACDSEADASNVAVTEQPLQPIRLPSDRSESETRSKTTADLPKSNTNTIEAIAITARPVTVVTTFDVRFLPINRHFQQYKSFDRPFRLRFPDRCRHLRSRLLKPWLKVREMSYGDDMILTSDRWVRERFGRVELPSIIWKNKFPVTMKHVKEQKQEHQSPLRERLRAFLNRF